MKICFWGHIADALKGTTIGGGELQMALLATSLAKAGHEVVVIDPFSKESFITPEGIKILHVPEWNKGIPGIRTLWYRIPGLYRLLVKQKADYYYVRMRSHLNLISYRAARKVKGKVLLAIASDVDLLSMRDKYKYEYKASFRLSNYLRKRIPGDLAFNYILNRADIIICQHAGQQAKAKSRKGKAIIFPSLIDLHNLPAANGSPEQYYIYVGSLTSLKGAGKLYDIVYDAAEKSQFMIVGQPNDLDSVRVFEDLKKLKNADVKGRYKHSDTLQLLAKAKAIINTSHFEGFPNVFLEAWAMGIPALSLNVNPGNIFDRYELGICFKNDLEKMKEYINGNGVPGISPAKMTAYVREFHDSETAAQRFLNVLNNA
jgi:Glycosyl transferases group 1